MKPIVKTLSTGLRTVIIPQPEAATVTALVLAGTGSKYESPQEAGLSHFLEHMCFKGTLNLPTPKIIAETLEGLGAISNAFTSHEYTGYYVKGNPNHLDTFLEVLSDIYLRATFPSTELEKEKGVIIEEINMYEDMPQHKVGEELLSLMYGIQPAGQPIIGSKATVRSFTREDFVRYRKNHYHAENTIVVICGPVPVEKVLPLVTKNFSDIEKGKASRKEKVMDMQGALGLRVHTRMSDQAHIAIGFRSLPFRHEKAAPLVLLATILGRGMSSRLFQTLREELGAAYYVNADHDSFTDHGIFGISAGIDKERPNDILRAIATELKLLKTTLVGEAELTKAREFTLGMMRLGLESTDDIAGFCGVPLVLKKEIKLLPQIVKEYQAVRPEDIRKMARKIFVPDRANIAIVGPYTAVDIDTSPFQSL
jgi:predicted Zn-dependent peptidase